MGSAQPTSNPPVIGRLGTPAESPGDLIVQFWKHRLVSGIIAAVIAVVSGVLIGIWMPRGPVDSRAALILLVCALTAGFLAGFAMRANWAVVLAPVLSFVTFEVVRRNESGPSVDGIHFDTMLGLIGFIVGRGVFALVALIPMALGAAYGTRAACALSVRRTGNVKTRGRLHIAGMAALILATLAVSGLAILLAMPASIPPVTDGNGEAIEGSIAELTAIDLGGHPQWIEINGASTGNPVILYLNGGPGQSDLALSRTLLEPLHQDFTVVGWDQRGAGKSYGSLDPETLTLDSVVDDTIELTNYLRQRFDQEKIYLLTESWGSIPGVLAVQQHPELYHAYIGSGQMVDLQETDRIIYDDLLAYAVAHGDGDLAEKLNDFGPPPYKSIWANAYILQHYDLIQDEYDAPQAYIDRGNDAGVGFWGIMGSEYTLIDKANVFRGLLDMAAVMYPQLQEIDFRTQVTELDVPVYLFDGAHELRGRRELAQAWFALLDAPVKKIYTFDDAGHAPAFEHADDLSRILREEIVPQATTQG